MPVLSVFMTSMSAGIAVLGLIIPSTAVVIGAMLVALILIILLPFILIPALLNDIRPLSFDFVGWLNAANAWVWMLAVQ